MVKIFWRVNYFLCETKNMVRVVENKNGYKTLKTSLSYSRGYGEFLKIELE